MAGYIGNKQKISGRYKVDEFTSSGGTTYTLSSAPGDKNNIQVSAGGLTQYPSAYSVSGTTLTLSGVPSGQKVVVRHMGDTIPFPLLDADVVTGAKIADNAIDSEHYTDGSIDNIHTNFQPGTIFKGDGSSARGKITLNCEMNTHGVSIQSPAHTSNATYTLTLPPNDGNASEFLQTNGSGVLSFAAAGGAWNLIGTSVASASASLTQTGLDSTYDTYVIVYSDFKPASDAVDIRLRLGDSSGIDSGGSDYAYHNHASAENSSSYSGQSSAGVSFLPIGLSLGNAAGEGGGGIAYLHQPGDATTFPIVTWSAGGVKESTIIQMSKGVGIRQTVITVDRVELTMSSGNITSGRMSVYGIAHA